MSKQRAWIVTLCGVLMIALGAPAKAQETRTPRDAYVEAWFQETAEADLEGALKLYKECADKAATSDRELAAKALLRMAKIASARGDADAARLLAERIATEFSGTSAAKDALNLSAGGEGIAKPVADTREIEDARKWLDEMLTNENDSSPRKADSVLRALGMEEVLRVYAARGGRLHNVFTNASAGVLEEADWVGLARRKDLGDFAPRIALQKLVSRKVTTVPETLEHDIDPANSTLAVEFVRLCTSVGTPESLAILERFVGTGVGHSVFQQGISMLVQIDTPGADRVVEAWFASLEKTGELLNVLSQLGSSGITLESLCESTSAADALRRRFPTFPARARVELTNRIANLDSQRVPEALFELLLADPEPIVRLRAIASQIRLPDSATRVRAAKALEKEPRPIDVQGLDGLFQEPLAAFADVLDMTTGTLREYLYSRFLMAKTVAAEVMHFGVEHDHVELLHALFDARIGAGDILVNGAIYGPQSAFRSANLAAELDAHADPDLLRKVIAAVIATRDERLRVATLEALRDLSSSRITQGIGDSFAALASPPIDLALADSPAWWKQLGDESARRLALHPAREVRTRAWRLASPELLLEAAARADAADLEFLFARAKEQQNSRLELAILSRAEPTSRLALDVFVELLPIHEEALVIACERGGSEDDLGIAAMTVIESFDLGDTDAAIRVQPGQSIAEARAEREAARERAKAEGNPVALVYGKLKGIELPGSLRDAIASARTSSPPRTSESLRAAAEILREHRAEWSSALVSWQARKIVAESLKNQGQSAVDYYGTRIAALGARDAAAALLENADPTTRQIGLNALAKLSDKERVLAYARLHIDPTEWLDAVLAVGASAEVREWVASGRLSAQEVLRRGLKDGSDFELAIDLALGERAVPMGGSWNSYELKRLVDRLTVARDVDRIARAVTYYDSADAVSALLQLNAIDRIFDEFPRWPIQAAGKALDEFRQRTGVPESNQNVDLRLRANRLDLVARWRAQLPK